MPKIRKTKSEADRFDPISAARDFLNVARAFKTTEAHNKSAPKFSTLVVRAVEAQLIKSSLLGSKFGIDWDKARVGRDTGVTSDKRKAFIQDMTAKAREIVPT